MNKVSGSVNLLLISVAIAYLSVLIYVFSAGFILNGNSQSLSYSVFYFAIFIFLFFLAKEGMYISVIFLAFAIYVLLTLPQSFYVYTTGIEFHRDARFHASFDLDLAVFKKFLSQFIYYGSAFVMYFIIPRGITLFKEPQYELDSQLKLKFALYIIFIVFFTVLLLYINQAGGINAALTQRSLVNYERAASQSGGHYVAFLKFSFLISIVWMIVDKKAVMNPWFWVALIFTIVVSGLLTGSRSTVVFNFLIFLLSYFLLYQKLPLKYVVPLFLVVILFTGYLTANRFVSNEKFQEMSFTEATASTYDGVVSLLEESAVRAGYIDASIGVYGLVPEAYDYAYGSTYKAIPFIPIPSILLPFDKPEAAGKSYTYMLVNHTDTGWPPRAVAEAYWNFSFVGVFVAGAILGVFYKLVNNTYVRNQGAPISMIIMLSTIFFFELGSDTLFKFVQFIGVACFMYLFVRISAMVRYS